MPKLKTNRAAAKRFKVSKTGKVKRSKAYAGHLATGKPGKKKRQLKTPCLVDKTNIKQVRKMLPGKGIKG
ncbi:MAG: 50S ribosomal protein L35 [Candidatus Ancaeobacter aquaticus]|nr:50S ribosomal protein L35 [Candidatus Ancaeobacter aquaticus]